jgi:peptidoglycan hydrolase CwlO-like protein
LHDNELIEAVEHEDHNLEDKEADIANTIGTNILETKDNQSQLQNINFCHHPHKILLAKPKIKL